MWFVRPKWNASFWIWWNCSLDVHFDIWPLTNLISVTFNAKLFQFNHMGATHSNELILARWTSNDSINTLNALVIKEPLDLWLKFVRRCVFIHQGPRQPVCVSLFALNKRTYPLTLGPKESKPQSLKSHLTAISYGALHYQHPPHLPARAKCLHPRRLASPMDSYRHPNRPKCAGSPTRMANCWAQPVCSTHGCSEERCSVRSATTEGVLRIMRCSPGALSPLRSNLLRIYIKFNLNRLNLFDI